VIDRFSDRNTARLHSEFTLGGKMVVESTMRKTSRLHNVGEANALESVRTKQHASHLENIFPALSGPLLGDIHGQLSIDAQFLDRARCGRRAQETAPKLGTGVAELNGNNVARITSR
jgi:hypothetical protein